MVGGSTSEKMRNLKATVQENSKNIKLQEKLGEGKKPNAADQQGQSPECLPRNDIKMLGAI